MYLLEKELNMDKNELIKRATSRANDLLTHPEIQGDLKKALLAACGSIEAITEQFAKETDALLTQTENRLSSRSAISSSPEPTDTTLKMRGRPKDSSNPISKDMHVTTTAFIAALWARHHGITNNREASEKYLRKLLGTEPEDKLVKNFQKRISAAKKNLQPLRNFLN